jgi:hypothetical protein
LESSIFSLLPLILMQSIYAILTVQIAKRTGRSVPAYLVMSLIPIIGAFFFIYVMWSTILFVLDSINELKAK